MRRRKIQLTNEEYIVLVQTANLCFNLSQRQGYALTKGDCDFMRTASNTLDEIRRRQFVTTHSADIALTAGPGGA
jgi:hypothetical protein